MNSLRFLSKSVIRSVLLTLSLALTCLVTNSQTISGHVYDACDGDPIGGATISISVNLPGSPQGTWNFETDPDGSWDFSFFGGDPNGPYTIRVGVGASSPSSYIYFRSQGNATFDFDLLPFAFNIGINEQQISWQNNPSSPHIVCLGDQNCVNLNEISDAIPIANGPYCYQLSLYKVNKSGLKGELLAESNCTSFGRLDIGNPCNHGDFDLSALLEEIEGEFPDVILMEVQQFCCESECNEGEGALVNTIDAYITIKDIGLADADFKLIDGTEGAGGDGIADRSETRPGPSIGEATCGIFVQDYTSGNEIDAFRIVLEEVDCEGDENPTLLHDTGNVPAPGGDLPATFTFNSVTGGLFLGPLAGFPPTAGRCFKVTLTIFNPCGGISVSSYFTIDQNCPFCLIQNPNENFADNLNESFLSEGQNINVFPNPVSSDGQVNFHFRVEAESKVSLDLFDNTGKQVRNMLSTIRFDEGEFSLTQDISGLPNGLYLYRFTVGEEVFTGKLVK